MKRLGIIALLLCLLGGAACAETVADQVNAPEHITLESFQTESGLSTFMIDAQVQVPSVDNLNTYEYHTLPVTEEMLRKVADALGLANIKIEPFSDVSEDHTSVSDRRTISRTLNDLRMWGSNSYFDDQNCNGTLGYDDTELARQDDCSAVANMWLWPCAGTTAPDTDYPFASATELAIQTAKRFAPDMTLVQSGVLASHIQLTAAEINKLNDPNYKGQKPDTMRYGAYGYLFARVVDGVVITHDENTSNCVPHTESTGLYPITYERLALVVKGGRVVSMRYGISSIAGAMKQEAVELLSFDQVLAIAKTSLPQKMQNTETHLGDGVMISYPIDSIVLGYMRVRVAGDLNTFELVPVWDFFGQSVSSPDQNPWRRPGTLFRESLLTLNAMNGTVIDRENGY